MKKQLHYHFLKTRLKLRKLWLRVAAHPVARVFHARWRGLSGVGKTLVAGAVIMAVGAVVLITIPSTRALQKSITISPTDMLSGKSSYGSLQISPNGVSMQLQNGLAGTWNQSGVNGMQIMPTLSNAPVQLVYGPNDTIYSMTAASGNCYLSTYSIERQTWNRLRSAPVSCGSGTVLRYDGAGSLYYLSGGPSTAPSNRFFRYDIASDTWSELSRFPSTVSDVNDGVMVAQGNKKYLYVTRGQGSPSFWRYSISDAAWQGLGAFPTSGTVSGGITLAWDKSNTIYALANTTGEFKKYDLATNTWQSLVNQSNYGNMYQAMTMVNGTLYALRLNVNSSLYSLRSYNPATSTWSDLRANPTGAGVYGYAPALISDNNRYLYTVMGSEIRPQLQRYDTQNATWNANSLLIGDQDYSGSHQMVAYDGSQSLYYVGGQWQGSSDRVFKYDLSSNTATRVGAQVNTTSGSTGAYYNGSVYFLAMLSTTTTFQRYDVSTNSFIALADAPFTTTSGASIVYGNDGYMYVTFGGRTAFYRYNISSNSWTALASVPQSPSAGGGMTRIGRTLYVLIGGQSNYLYQYNMDNNTWTAITNIPAGSIDHGAFITSDGSKYLYMGISDRTQARSRMVVRYDTTNGSWVRIADLPQAAYPQTSAFYNTTSNTLYVANGFNNNSLWSWSPGSSSYATSGTWLSKSYDLKQVSTWQSLQATVTGATNGAVFATRTSPDGVIWTDWQPTSGQAIASPVNRYIQVKVTLTGDGTASPTVSGIQIHYDQETTPPSVPSQFSAYDKQNGTQLTSGATSPAQHPYFTWNGADDGANGSGVVGYYVYFGTNSSADPQTDGSYQTDSAYTVDTPMTAGSVYYVRIKSVDALGNTSGAATFFSYRYFYISPPGSQIRTSSDDFSQGMNSGVGINNGAMSLTSNPSGAWATGPLSMPPEDTRAGAMVVVGDYIYTARGTTTNTFWRYNTVTMSWSTLGNIPTTVNAGGSLTYDGNDTIYLTAGNNTNGFYKYSITNDSWSALPALPSNAQSGTTIKYLGNDQIAVMITGVREFYLYSISSSTFTPKSAYPTTISNGGSGMWYDGRDTIYAYMGSLDIWSSSRANRPNIAAYTISTDSWKVLATAPVSAVYNQNNLLSDGKGGLYIFTSNLSNNLTANQRALRYDIASDSWSEVRGAPYQAYFSTAASDEKRFIYVLPAGLNTNARKIVRYDTWTNTFTPNAPTVDSLDRIPWDAPTNAYQWLQGNATTAAYDGSKYLYALTGSENNNSTSRFVQFDYKTNETNYLTSPPVVGQAGSMAYLNGYIYYMPSRSTKSLYRYDLSTQLWTMMADAPAISYRPGSSSLMAIGSSLYTVFGNTKLLYKYTPDSGLGTWSALAQSPVALLNGAAFYDKTSNGIYMLPGNNSTSFYKYDVASNSWTSLANLPIGSSYGASIIAKNGKVYAMLGNLSKAMYVYTVSTNSWSVGTSSPEQYTTGSQFIDVSDSFALSLAGSNSPDIWQFNYPSATTAYSGQAVHVSNTFAIQGLFDYSNVTAEVTLPENTAVELWTRTSADGTNWEDWKQASNIKKYSTSISGIVTSKPQQFTQVKVVLISYDNIFTPTVGSYALNYYYDVDPPNNPTAFSAYTAPDKTSALQNNTWYNTSQPYFDWPEPGQPGGATDGPLGSNVAGYWVYVGTDPTATPRTAGTFVSATEYRPQLTISGTYYVRIQAQDATGNVDPSVFSPFIYKFDNQAPTNPALITVTPSGFTTRNNFSFVWPNAYDADSGVAGYCYHTGAPDGPFAVETCQAGTSLDNISAAYQSGTNVFYIRAYDNAGNYAPSYTTVSFYYTTDPPGPVTNLRAVPPTSTANLFAFTWDLPITYSGDPDQMTYCYSVNILPSPENTTCTSDRFISPFKAATQKGTNIIYMVAKDEAKNVNWNAFASANFIANTVSPGIPLNVTASDTSERATSRWTITLTWDKPTFEGNGIKDYVVQRSTDGHTFTSIGNTSTRAFVDLDVQLDTQYYYRVAAEDSVENMSGFSGIVIQSAKGTYNAPPTVVVDPKVIIGFDQARITWATDRPSTSFIYYGTSPTDLSQSKGSLDLATAHDQTINGLSPSKTYYYRIQSFDLDRNYDLKDAYSDIGTFRTTVAAQIGNVRISDITADSATVTWTTTVPTNARLQYGSSLSYGLQVDDDVDNYTSTHISKITSLSAGTQYHTRILSTTASGSTITSDDYTFSTIPRPVISNIRFQPIDNEPTAGVVVTWDTNIPTSSTVRYRALGAQQEASLSELTTSHRIDLHNLAGNTDYQFNFEGRDQYGNLTTSTPQRWRSQVDTRPPEIGEASYNVTTIDSAKGKQAQLIVTWKTDEPASSQIFYGSINDSTLNKSTPLDTEPTTNHVVVLSGLDLADIYKVQIVSRDLDGNTAKGNATSVVTPDKQFNIFDTTLNLMLRLFRF